jgi:hypothetical protein
LLSTFAFEFILRRYTLALSLLLRGVVYPLWWVLDRWCPLRMWRGLTLVHFSAQPVPSLTQNAP